MAAIEFPTNPARDATFTDAGGTPWVCDNSISSGDTYTSWSKAIPIAAENIVFTPSGNIVATNVGTAITELDTEKVAKAGDTMTGQLKGITPVAIEDLTRKDYVDGLTTALGTEKVAKAGDTMTGQLKGITPVAAEDLTRKDYVDASIVSSASVSNRGKNLVDNGDFTIWQRGDAFPDVAANVNYTADRWLGQVSQTNGSIDRVPATANDGKGDSLKITQGSDNFGKVSQGIEWNNQFIPNTKFTLSYEAKSIDGGKMRTRVAITNDINTPTSLLAYLVDTTHALTFGFVKYQYTFTIPAGVSLTAEMLFVEFNNGATSTDTTMEIRQIQLEAGDMATDFEITHPADQLARCQRYCQLFPAGFNLGVGTVNSGPYGHFSLNSHTAFRAIPVLENGIAPEFRIAHDTTLWSVNLTSIENSIAGVTIKTDIDAFIPVNNIVALKTPTKAIFSADFK